MPTKKYPPAWDGPPATVPINIEELINHLLAQYSHPVFKPGIKLNTSQVADLRHYIPPWFKSIKRMNKNIIEALMERYWTEQEQQYNQTHPHAQFKRRK